MLELTIHEERRDDFSIYYLIYKYTGGDFIKDFTR